jgi:hypothetical protein
LRGRRFDVFRGRGDGSLRGTRGLYGLRGFRGLGGFGGLFWLHLATKPVRVGAATDSVGLGVLDRRRGAGSSNAEFLGECKQLFARETEFLRELVHTDLLLSQNLPLLLVRALRRAQLSILPQSPLLLNAVRS